MFKNILLGSLFIGGIWCSTYIFFPSQSLYDESNFSNNTIQLIADDDTTPNHPPVGACTDLNPVQDSFKKHNGEFKLLTENQLNFLRGIYIMNPATPPGMPIGDLAFLATVAGDEGGVVFFGEGDRVCMPMPIPKVILDKLKDISENKIVHEEGRL